LVKCGKSLWPLEILCAQASPLEAATTREVAEGADVDGKADMQDREVTPDSELEQKLRVKRSELDELQVNLHAIRCQNAHKRVCLQHCGDTRQSLVPAQLRSGGSIVGGPGSTSIDMGQQLEMRSLLKWVVDNVDLSQQAVFECGGHAVDVVVANRRVVLHCMAAWCLQENDTSNVLEGALGRSSGLNMTKLSVPVDIQADIFNLVSTARVKGDVSDLDAERWTAEWEIIGAEVVTAGSGLPEPAIFLVRRRDAQAIVIAQWPSIDFARPLIPSRDWAHAGGFDPWAHFQRLSSSSPFSLVQPAETIPGKEAVAAITVGEKVEVHRDGRWLPGILHEVVGELASVRCDHDLPGVIAVHPLTSVRRAEQRDEDTSSAVPARFAAVHPEAPAHDEAQHKDRPMARHVRAKSCG